MRKETGNSPTITCLPLCSLIILPVTLAAESQAIEPRILAYVSELTPINRVTLNSAQELASKIFAQVGIEIRWAPADVSGKERNADFVRSSHTVSIRVRILRRSREQQGRLGPITGGGAVRMSANNCRGIIYIFLDRLSLLTRSERIPLERLLGITLAHEIGHLVLPPEYHSRSGIMKAELDDKDWWHVLRYGLRFSAREGSIMRNQVRAWSVSAELRQAGHRGSLQEPQQ